MKLSKEQINQLYTFTRQHYVEWYDLQTELVDHLANDIESIWKKEPQLSFNQAKNKAFKKFGIFGFGDVIKDKSNAVSKHYRKLLWKIFKDFFKPPKVIITLLITLIIFSLINLTAYHLTILIIAFWIIFIIPIIFGLWYKLELNKRFKDTGKKWLIDEVIKQSGLLFIISIQIPIQLLKYINPEDALKLNSTELLVASFFLSIFIIFVYILTKVIPPRLEKEMIQLYPEYKLLSKG